LSSPAASSKQELEILPLNFLFRKWSSIKQGGFVAISSPIWE
jgi:hypothetical protein